jgi:mono/diheme cytochrome c family protein
MYVGATSSSNPLAPETLAPETLNEQTDDLGPLLRRAALGLVALVITVLLAWALVRYVQASDPYIHEVLSLEGNVAQGEAIFRMNCAVCHGLEATGEVGPTLVSVSDHRTKVSLIKQVISGQTPPMPQFQPDPQAMADLLGYLESL